MKNLLPQMIFILFTLASCDSPRSQRALSSTYNNGLTSSGNIATVNLDNTNSSSTSTTSTTTTGTTNSVVPSDATHCKFATDGVSGFESTSTHLGEYTLCQSSTDKNTAYFQLKTPPTGSNGDVSICLIPTTSSGSNSIYVGNPMCGYFKDPKSVRKITFIKYSQYSNATITGVLFFKDLSWYYPVYNSYMMTLDAYKTCMNMLAYGNTAYCSSFKQVGQYVFKQF
jgi:hypothetical protein